MFKKVWLIFIMALFLISGCASVSYLPSTSQAFSPTTSVEILWKEPHKPYIELGKIIVEDYKTWTSQETLFRYLKERAMKLGADAVIVTSTQSGQRGLIGMPRMEGIAIKYKEK